MTARVLIVTEDESLGVRLGNSLQGSMCEPSFAHTLQEAAGLIASAKPIAVLLEAGLAAQDGSPELIQTWVQQHLDDSASAQKMLDELRRANTEKDRQVEQAHREVAQINVFLEQAQRELRTQLLNAVKVFSGLIELRSPVIAAHSRRVAEISKFIAMELGFSDHEVFDAYVAGLLHDIGKLSLHDDVLNIAVADMDGNARAELNKHPLRGQLVLSAMHDLHGVAAQVRHHHERFDGQGVPDGLFGDKIPKGARVLAVAEDFEELQLGWLSTKKLTEEEALKFIQGSSGKRYDPAVVAALPKAIEHLNATPKEGEVILHTAQLLPGMRVSRNLISPDGMLLMVHDGVVSDALIQHLFELKTTESIDLNVYVYKKSLPKPA